MLNDKYLIYVFIFKYVNMLQSIINLLCDSVELYSKLMRQLEKVLLIGSQWVEDIHIQLLSSELTGELIIKELH